MAAWRFDADSVFIETIKEFGLEAFEAKIFDLGCECHADFSQAANFQPGNPDETPFIDEVVVPVLGRADHPMKIKLRRLFYESHCLSAAEMANKLTARADDERPQKLPGPERAARLKKLAESLPGLDLEGDLEPSDILIDKCFAQVSNKQVRFIPWDELTRKSDEIRGVKKVNFLQLDANGIVKQSQMLEEDPADTSTNELLRFALTRRGVALHVGQAMSFKVHDAITKFLMKELSRAPISKNHNKVSLEQVLSCDKEICARLAEETKHGFPTLVGKFPLDDLVPTILAEPRIGMLLAQLARTAGGTQSKGGDGSRRENVEVDRLKSENKKLKEAMQRAGKGKGLGKASGKVQKHTAKPSQPFIKMPKLLVGMKPSYNGERLCFDFNLGKCTNPKSSCPNGLHKCMKCGNCDKGAVKCR